MGIEDIREMQIRENGFNGLKEIDPSISQGFSGRFLLLEGANGKGYIFSERNYFFTAKEIFLHFQASVSEEYQYNERFSPIGGGTLTINEKKIIILSTYLWGEEQIDWSDTRFLEGYHLQKERIANQVTARVRPIAKIWKQQHFPNHELAFE